MDKLRTMFQIARTFGLRNGFQRLNYELQRGSGLMSRRMRKVGGWRAWDLQHIASGSPGEFLSSRRQVKRRFFFSDCRQLESELKEIIGTQGEKQVIAEANEILKGKLPYFGRLSLQSGFPPRWLQNPLTGQTVNRNRSWTGMRFADPEFGDLKFILEPSRFLFVYPLVRAYAISGDERFADAFWNALEAWVISNPPMSGPLWICGQESALRIMALGFSFYAFVGSAATTPQRTSLLLSVIAAHAWRIALTVGYARSQRSNHLISEAVGLWTAGVLFPELNEAVLWKREGASLLLEAVLDQISPEGVHVQNSFNYQRMVVQQLVWTIRLADINHESLPPEIRVRTNAALDFMSQIVDRESGRAPNYGANDGTNLLPLSSCEYSDFRPLIKMGSCIVDRPSFLKRGLWDEVALWLGQPTAAAPSGDAACKSASSTGYFRLGSENSWGMVRAGHYERRPFQSDQLHLDLWWQGLNIARDPGTYLYNSEPPWDNSLAGTPVHNTVTVDGRNQMRRAGRFLWLDWAQARGRTYSAPSSNNIKTLLDRFEGEHDGYRHSGVRHLRAVQWVPEDAWVIVDDLLALNEEDTRKHELTLHWLLPNLPMAMTSSASFAFETSEKVLIRWSIFASSPGRAVVVRAGKNVLQDALQEELFPKDEQIKILGWESPTYGELRPAISLLYSVRGPLPVRMVTVVTAGEKIQLRQTEDSVVLSNSAAELYRVGLRPQLSSKVTV
jgi:hypothetical protein